MRKENITYYFSVEGNTEKWYFEWLQRTINADENADYTVKLDVKIQKNPLARVKNLTILGTTEITHVFDRESEEEYHIQQFQATLRQMKDAQKIGKNIKYCLGYSNFAFELWIILHKDECNGSFTHRRQYLKKLNEVYRENFNSLDEYKREDNFKRILSKLTLEDVGQAIYRAKMIMKYNKESNYNLIQYCGYEFYKENPSLSIWQTIEGILIDCNLIESKSS